MPSQEIQNILPKIQHYLSTQPVERAYLFGSYARGEQREDIDVDLLVTYTDSDSLSLMDISRMMISLEKFINRKVDLIEEDCLKPFARATADNDKIKIYERTH